MRLFVAAALPEELRRHLEEIQGGLRGLPWRVRWVRKEAMHLTFVFLGEVASSRLEPIVEALGKRQATPVGPFRLEARGLGTFPPSGKPRVIWAGLEGDLEAARRLKAGLDNVLEPLGFPPEERAFRPHLTVGRVAEGGSASEGRSILEPLSLKAFGTFEVDACVLYESRLLADGAQYVALRRFPLSGVAGAER